MRPYEHRPLCRQRVPLAVSSPCAPTNFTLAIGCCRCQGNTHFPCSEALFAARITPPAHPPPPPAPPAQHPHRGPTAPQHPTGGTTAPPSTPQGGRQGGRQHPTPPTPPRPRPHTPTHPRTRPHTPAHAHAHARGTYARISGVTGIRAVPVGRTRIRANRAGAPLERFEVEPRRSDLRQHKGGAMVLDDASRSTATKKRGSNTHILGTAI